MILLAFEDKEMNRMITVEYHNPNPDNLFPLLVEGISVTERYPARSNEQTAHVMACCDFYANRIRTKQSMQGMWKELMPLITEENGFRDPEKAKRDIKKGLQAFFSAARLLCPHSSPNPKTIFY